MVLLGPQETTIQKFVKKWKEICEKFQYLERVSLPSDYEQSSALPPLPNLKSLSMGSRYRGSSIDWEALRLQESFPKLEELHIASDAVLYMQYLISRIHIYLT